MKPIFTTARLAGALIFAPITVASAQQYSSSDLVLGSNPVNSWTSQKIRDAYDNDWSGRQEREALRQRAAETAETVTMMAAQYLVHISEDKCAQQNRVPVQLVNAKTNEIVPVPWLHLPKESLQPAVDNGIALCYSSSADTMIAGDTIASYANGTILLSPSLSIANRLNVAENIVKIQTTLVAKGMQPQAYVMPLLVKKTNSSLRGEDARYVIVPIAPPKP